MYRLIIVVEMSGPVCCSVHRYHDWFVGALRRRDSQTIDTAFDRHAHTESAPFAAQVLARGSPPSG